MLRAIFVLIPLTGCSLYFNDAPSPTDDARPNPDDAGAAANVLARPCIHTLVAGNLAAPIGKAAPGEAGLITYTCTGTGPVVESVVDSGGGGIEGSGAEADYQIQFTRTIVDDVDGYRPLDVIATFSPMMWIFVSNGGYRVTFDRPFSDLWIGDLDGNHQRDFVAAGDGAVRIASATSQTYGFPLEVHATDETELFAGKPFRWIAVSDLAGSAAPDILYVTDNAGDIELDLATQTQASPLAFTTNVLAHVTAPGVADPALVITDIDGDGKPDVIGAHKDVWIYSTRAGALYTWPAHGPRAIAGGHGEFVYADEGTIYRGSISGGVLHVDPLVADPAVDALAIGDLDGNNKGDVLALHGIDTPDSVVVRYAR